MKYNDCGSLIAPLYFIAFVVIGSFLMLNLLIAVVLENFSANSKVRFKRQRADEERGGGAQRCLPCCACPKPRHALTRALLVPALCREKRRATRR